MNKNEFIERFIQYAKIDTQSNPSSQTVPTTQKQKELSKLLASQLTEMGVNVIYNEETGYVYGKLAANIDSKKPTIGYIAHVDTAPDYSGLNVKPQIIDNYDGKTLEITPNFQLDPKTFPDLLKCVNQTLITTDGTTLLGSDDKSGVTIIMEMIKYYYLNPEVKHAEIAVAFTVDEEVGRGADHFDIALFGADFAYTIDGGELGEFSYENFNAATVNIEFYGVAVHPGSAKNKMKNSLNAAAYFQSLMPAESRPENTELREGFIHLHEFTGNIEKSTLEYIVRDHDYQKFEEFKKIIESAYELTLKRYKITGKLEITDSYYNMRAKITDPLTIDLVIESMKELNIPLINEPIRGGTDGARLSYMGLPTPNIFTGGFNFHGRYEFLSVDMMVKSCQLLVKMNERLIDEK